MSQQYTINIIDTPGLFEIGTGTVRDTNEIMRLIHRCIDMEITKIHQVFFVYNLRNGLFKEDLDSFSEFLKVFKGMEDKISILLTFSESWGVAKKQNIRKQFEDLPQFAHMKETVQNKIFYLGSLNKDRMEVDTQEVTNQLQKSICVQRLTLLDHITKLKETFNVKDLLVYKNQETLVKNLVKAIQEYDKQGKYTQEVLYAKMLFNLEEDKNEKQEL